MENMRRQTSDWIFGDLVLVRFCIGNVICCSLERQSNVLQCFHCPPLPPLAALAKAMNRDLIPSGLLAPARTPQTFLPFIWLLHFQPAITVNVKLQPNLLHQVPCLYKIQHLSSWYPLKLADAMDDEQWDFWHRWPSIVWKDKPKVV